MRFGRGGSYDICGLVWRRKCSGVSKDGEKLLSSFQGVRDLWVEPQVQGGARV
jgi:hypothetical protein